MLDLPRLLVGAAILLYAVWTDLKTRRVPNRTWLIPIGAGLALDLPDGLEGGAPFLRDAAVSAGLMVPLALLLYHVPGSGFGGADAKALMALSVLFPRWPLAGLLVQGSPAVLPPFNVFTLAVLCNALLAGLALPPGLALLNLARGDRSRHMGLGYPVPVSRLDPVRMKLLGDPTGDLRPRFGGRELTPELLAHLRGRLAPDARVWVTPKLPFMVPLAAGFGVALVAGNLLLLAVLALR